MADRDLSKLPKWARQEIERLRQVEVDLRARLAVGPDDADTFVADYVDADAPLGEGTMIRFRIETQPWPKTKGKV
jgi:hypothetical protein